MKFVFDPPIATKISKMKQRVRWQEAAIAQRQIDQTRLILEDGHPDQPEFSFLVIGDSGSGPQQGHNPQRTIAEQMLAHRQDCRFVLHTGDVIYLVGSSEFYPKNFIEPYREFLVGGSQGRAIAFDRMVFDLPILPVLGNHDYYDLPFWPGLLLKVTFPLRRLLEKRLDLDIGWHGSGQGQAYAQAFMDYLKALDSHSLEQHLDQHYTGKIGSHRCLSYQPGHFTRLPNRYYTFRSGGIDFFALDSNTFNAPAPLPITREGEAYRRQLEQRRQEIEQETLQLLEQSAQLQSGNSEEAEQLNDIRAKLSQLEEVQLDIDKQLAANETTVTDLEQLEWLQARLIESWNTHEVRGRILYFHHPPYVTEATKWHQAQTLAVRHRLRRVLDAVATEVGSLAEGRPIVDLVLNGHAHCLEYLRTEETGHADSFTDWIVCGGSGFSLRRQREEGPDITEVFGTPEGKRLRLVARSHCFVGRRGQGTQKRRPYSFVRIDVQEGTPLKLIVRPFVSERFHGQWRHQELPPIKLGG